MGTSRQKVVLQFLNILTLLPVILAYRRSALSIAAAPAVLTYAQPTLAQQ
jgi:hypothetical protein